jgi:CRISPR-associated protein (TIGR03984 family)
MINIEPQTVEQNFVQSPEIWLLRQARNLDLPYALIHGEDGVTWGKMDKDSFIFSFQVFDKDLDKIDLVPQKILHVRLFGEKGELNLWRTGGGEFLYHLIMDDKEPDDLHIDETYWLWGTGYKSSDKGFTLMSEGQQGLRHAPPFNKVNDKQRLGLCVRHYILEEENGWQRIQTSRLLGLKIVEGGGK